MFWSLLPWESDAFINKSHFAVPRVDTEIKIDFLPVILLIFFSSCNFKPNAKLIQP